MDIKDLKKEEIELRGLIAENRQKQRNINKEAFIKMYRIDIGDAVEWVDGTIKKGVIIDIEFSGVIPQYYKASLFNSDGKVGKRECRIWSFSFKSLKLLK